MNRMNDDRHSGQLRRDAPDKPGFPAVGVHNVIPLPHEQPAERGTGAQVVQWIRGASQFLDHDDRHTRRFCLVVERAFRARLRSNHQIHLVAQLPQADASGYGILLRPADDQSRNDVANLHRLRFHQFVDDPASRPVNFGCVVLQGVSDQIPIRAYHVIVAASQPIQFGKIHVHVRDAPGSQRRQQFLRRFRLITHRRQRMLV